MKAREQFFSAYGIRLTQKNHIRILALLMCTEVVLAFSYLGFIQIPLISVTTLSILVIVAAMYFGPRESIALSLVFALLSVWTASVTSVEAGDIIFSPFLSGKPAESLIMAVLTRVAFALLAGLMFRRFFSKKRKNRRLGIALISVAATAIHALLVYACMAAFFGAAAADTGNDFSRSLILSNLLLYAVTVLVTLAFDSMMRSSSVRHFMNGTSDESVSLTKEQKHVSVILSFSVMLACILICIHFMSRIVGYMSVHNNSFDRDYISWTYALLAQFVLGLAAAFGIIAVILRWMQEYFAIFALESGKNERLRGELISRMSGNEGVFIINCETDSRKTVSDSVFSEEFRDSESYSPMIGRYIDSHVAEEDRRVLREASSARYMLERANREKEYAVRYRQDTGDGLSWYEMRVIRYSDTEVLQSFKNIDALVAVELAQKAISDDYFAIYIAELNSDIIKVIKRSPAYRSDSGLTANRYSESIRTYIAGLTEKDRQKWAGLDTAEGVKSFLADQDKREILFESSYRENRLTRSTWYVLDRKDGEAATVCLAFSELDREQVSRERLHEQIAAQQTKMEQQLEIIGGLADEYTALYHIDLDTGAYIPYHLTEKTDDIRIYLDRYPHFADLARAFATSELVHPDSSAELIAFYPSEACVREALRHKKRTSMLFLRNYDGEYLWTEANIIKCEDREEEARNILVGFIEKDREIRERNERFKNTEEANKLVDGVASRYSVAYTVDMSTGDFKLLKLDQSIRSRFRDFSSFEEAREALNGILHISDRERMLRELSFDSIRGKLQGRKSYTAEFRTLTGGVTKWHEMNITAVNKNVVALGFAERDLEITKRHLEDKRYDEYFALFVVDFDTAMLKALKNSPPFETIVAGEAASYEESMKKFSAIYQGEARDFFDRISSLEYLAESFAADDKKTFSYRSARLGKDKWIDVVSYVILRHEDGTPAMLTIGFSVVDTLATARKELLQRLNEDMQMIGGLASEYHALYYFNIAEKAFKTYSLDEKRFPEAARITGAGGDAADTVRRFGTSELVHPEDRHLFADLSFDTILERLAHSKRFSIRFRRNFGGEYLWTEMDVVKYEDIDETPNAIAVGFAERDAEIRSEQALSKSFELLGEEISPEEAVKRLMAIAGEFYGAERCYVFEYAKSIDCFSNTYEWCAEGVESMMSRLQRIPMREVEGWNAAFEQFGAFYMDTLDSEGAYTTSEGRKLLEMQGIESLIAAPLMNGEEIIGFIGIDNPSKAKQSIRVLKNAATVIFSEILKRNENDEEHITLGKLADAFLAVYYADLSSDYMRTWKIDETYKEAYGNVTKYSEAMGGFVRENIAERDRERCIRMTSPEYILEQFRERDQFSIDMTDILLSYERSIVVDFIKVSEDGSQLVICSRDVTESLQKEKEEQQFLQAALETEKTRARDEKAYQLAILNNAYSYFRINLSRNRIIPPIIEREHGQPVDYTSKFPSPLPSYAAVMAAGAERYVDEEYKESYRKYNSPEHLIECFSRGEYMPEYTCHIYSTTIGWHYRKYVTYLSRDEVSGDIYGMSVAYDVTKEYEAARREEQYRAELEKARSAAEEANKSKTDFLFNMSHDIRTPMNAITGFTSMAIKHIDDREKALDCMAKIQKSGTMLLSLINSVLEVSRIESGHATLDRQPGDIYFSFANIESTMRELAETKDIDLSFEFGNIRDRYVYADYNRCMRVFVNVISNAVKYTNEGGFVRVRCEQLGKAEGGWGRYRYTVTDNGIGMSEEFQKHVFEQFAREKTSTVSGIQGSGLGMTVVKSFVDLMDGTVTVESRQGVGTTFTIELPFELQRSRTYIDPVTGEVISSSEEGINHEEADFRGRRVLLVEDNEMNREIAIDILEEERLIVEEADDGTAAVEMLRKNGPDYYDFILMDIQMPVMNGYEATRAIRAMYPESKIPIIALSANAFAEDKEASLEAGMDDHVAKPINVKALFGTLAKYM